MKFTFGDIVVVNDYEIGVVVKSWVHGWRQETDHPENSYEVYVRNDNAISEFPESKIERYMVRHKELSEEEMEYQYNATHPMPSKEEINKVRDLLKEAGLIGNK